MKNYLKRSFALAMVLAMVLSFVPANVFAAEEAPALPTATITPMEESGYTYAMDIECDPTSDQLTAYGSWRAEYELRFNKEITLNDDGSADGFVSIKNGAMPELSDWTSAPKTDLTLPAGETLGVMAYVLTNPDTVFSYVPAWFYDFQLGIVLDEEFMQANRDLQVTLELKLYDPETNEGVVIASQSFGMPPLPTATATPIQKDDLTYAMNFTVDEITEEQLAYYGSWYADFELTVSKDMTFNANGTADGYLSGEYGDYGWVNAPISDVTLKAGESLKIMDYAAELMGKPGLKYTFKEVCEAVKSFNCGVFIEPQFLLDNPDLVVTLELNMYNPKNEDEVYSVGESYEFVVEEAPELPTATATDLEKDDLTFAMNFKADEATAAQLAYYGKWYADFELTVNKDVTFDANGTADGWLAGQYDGEWESWHGEWMNVPFKPVTLNANEPLKIMAFAAETLGEPGLKYTYKEVYEVVKNFNCGAYFTPEFLAANPDLQVALELKLYNRGDESISHVIGDTYVFENNFVAHNINTDKLYTAVSEAMDEAVSGETVRLIQDAQDYVVSVLEGVTLDLNGHTLQTQYLFATHDVVDESEANTGVLNVTKNVLLQQDNRQLPVKTAEGYKFFEILRFPDASQAAGEDSTKYMFQPFFEPAAHEALLAGQLASGVTIRVRVSWTRDENTVAGMNFDFTDTLVNKVINSYKPATGKYGQMFTLTLNGVSNYPGLTYQAYVVSDKGTEFTVASTVKEETNLNTTGASAVVAEGTKVTGSLSLKVTDLEESDSNITVEEGETLKSMDIHVDGVAADNTVPVLVTVEGLAEPGLNNGNLKLYHEEKGENVLMTQVATLAEVDAHNEFYYDPATGNITMALASFSVFTTRTVDENAWNNDFDYNWYDADAEELYIANADQLAAFGAIVGGMNGKTADSFVGQTVKLINDIYIRDTESENGRMFYPIGYYNTNGNYEKVSGGNISSGFRDFSGTFDGNGHKIVDFYQNTWEAVGDYNDGYTGTPNHCRDGFGLFGRVYKGTVKNLTVENFSSDGEFSTTGTIAAYAEGATFENIAIFNCNPRVYNIGNGGIVGCVGWYAREADLKTTFTNITVDNTNKISALWGSWDVACGGIVGQYYPTSGQTSYDTPANGGIHFENCHVAAQIDVYNDVCANYQYYAYRYAGILMGSVRENETIDGHVYPKMAGITAKGCTVSYADWQNYYYCELVANSKASYTHDHQFSRLERVQAVNGKTVTYFDGTTEEITGTRNFVVVNGEHGTDNAECFHFVNGETHTHDSQGTEVINGKEIPVEDHRHIYLPFRNQLFTGYGWGVSSVGIEKYDGVAFEVKNYGPSVPKFSQKEIDELSNAKTYTIGDLFAALDLTSDVPGIDGRNVQVFVSPADDESTVVGTYTKNDTWTQGTLSFTGYGKAVITITDYFFCTPTPIEVEVTNNAPVTPNPDEDIELPFEEPNS